MNNQYEDVLARITKRMAEEIDREYINSVVPKHTISFLYKTPISDEYVRFTTNYPDPRTVTTYVYGGTKGIATYTSTTEFIYNEPEKKIADPKLQRVLERNYELARCRHDVKQMRRLEKQMHANYK